jgi:cysteine synthase
MPTSQAAGSSSSARAARSPKVNLSPSVAQSYAEACDSTGIGQGRVTDNLATFVNDLDGSLMIADEKSIVMLYQLLDTEGLYLGASSALNVVAAVEVAQKLGKGAFDNCSSKT